jgi:Ca-activated chloride channel family protein
MMVVLDTSASMRVEDFRDRNRMEVAKQTIKEFILGRQNDRIGFEAFSGEAVTLAPPTLDYEMIIEALENTEMGDLRDGTAIGDALATAVNRLKESRAKSRIIVLLTDGDSNVGQIDPLTAGELAKGYGIKVYSIAIGKDGRQSIPFIQKDIFGRSVKTYQTFESSINPELLKKVSAMTDGKFYRVQDDVKVLRDVFRDIDQLEKNKFETKELTKYEEHFEPLIWAALLLLFATLMLQVTWLRVSP